MGTFHYSNPPSIHWGAGCATERLPAALDEAGLSRVFVVTTGSVAKNPALAGAVEKALGARVRGQFAEISQHAPVRAVAALAEAVRKSGAEALVSIGGGSPIDAAKAAAWSLASGVDLAAPGALGAAQKVSLRGKAVLPHFAVPTTLSVAELSGSAGFSSEHAHEKVGVAAQEIIPTAVFYDAALAVHTPLPLWLSTGIRAVDHAVETLLASGEHPLPDASALESLRRMPAALRAAKADPGSPAARTEGQVAAWLSYLLPTAAARGLSHTLGKAIGARHGVPHGVTSCLILPHAMRFYAARNPVALEQIAAALEGRAGALAGPGADAAPALVARLVEQLGQPRHIAEFGLSDGDLVAAAKKVAKAEWPEAELLAILRAAY